ncbi:MAG: hypothetical protein WD407_10595 [Rhodospirillales bacterium]
MRSRALSAGVSLALCAIFAFPAAAKKAEDLAKKFALPTHVQLRPFPAPTSRAGAALPITVFLEAVEKEQVGRICHYLPRIMDAIMVHLYSHPLPVNGRQIDLGGTARNMVAPINRALGGAWVKSVYIEKGAREMSKGSVSRLPFNAAGCKGIKDLKKAAH